MNNRFLGKYIKSLLYLVSTITVLAICSLPVSAQSAGYDLLQTGSGASVDLSAAGLGKVPLQGVPIQAGTGTTDTIMHRTKDIPADGGTTPVEVTAVFMKSVGSVALQGQKVDVYITLNNSGGTIPTSVLPQPDALSGSNGTITVRKDSTFDSSITVNADVIFVKAGSSVTDPANYVAHQPASSITLTSSGSTWSATPPAGYPSSPSFPSGGFYPRPVHNGPHPVVPSTCATTATTTSPTTLSNADAKSNGATGNAVIGIPIQKCVSTAL